MYGTMWCGDCFRARAFFDRNGVPYEWVDISSDAADLEYVMQVNNGMRSVPTILFPDGSILTEPNRHELAEKLGLP